jgi:hypothetical protein
VRALVALILLYSVAHAAPRSALVIVVDRAMTPEKLDVVNDQIREALAKMPDDVRVAIVSAGRKPHVVAPYQAARSIRHRTIAADFDSDVTAALGRACAILSIKANRLPITRAFVISDRDSLLGVSSFAKKSGDAGYQVSAYGLGRAPANRKAIAAIAVSGGGMAYHQSDGVSLAEALVEEATRTSVPAKDHAYILVLDRTAAMSGSRLVLAKEALAAGVAALAPNDRVAMIEYGAVATVYVRPQRAANPMRLTNDIARLTPILETDTGDLAGALELANEVVAELPASHKHVVIVASNAWPRAGVNEALQRLKLRSEVHCVAVDERLRQPLEQLAATIVLDRTDTKSEAVVKLFEHPPVDD